MLPDHPSTTKSKDDSALMKVSVEISTFNNKDLVWTALNRLAIQTYPFDRFEVIISDDGSADGLVELIEGMKGKLPYRITVLKHRHKGPSNAHNCGIQAADGDIVIMLAADILASPALVAEHVRSHRENPASHVMVSGRLVQSPELPDTIFQRSWDKLLNRLFEKEKDDLRHGLFFVSNLSFKKDFMLRNGMFREWPPASQEDLELGYRLKQNGMTLVHNPRALGYHHHPTTPQSVARRAYTQGYNWHFFENQIPEAWIKARSGNIRPSDGLGLYCRTLLKHSLRKFLINDLTVPTFIVPLVKNMERQRYISPIAPMLISKVTLFYFYKGLSDYRHGLPHNPSAISITATASASTKSARRAGVS